MLALRLHPFKTQTCLLLALLGPCFETGRTNPILTGSVQVRLIGFITFNPQSRGFSHFPQGTCALSVSELYLSFGGKHHPIHSVLPNTATHIRTPFAHQHCPWAITILAGYSNPLTMLLELLGCAFLQFKRANRVDSGTGSTWFARRYLRYRYLLSFPSSTDMLNFEESSSISFARRRNHIHVHPNVQLRR